MLQFHVNVVDMFEPLEHLVRPIHKDFLLEHVLIYWVVPSIPCHELDDFALSAMMPTCIIQCLFEPSFA